MRNLFVYMVALIAVAFATFRGFYVSAAKDQGGLLEIIGERPIATVIADLDSSGFGKLDRKLKADLGKDLVWADRLSEVNILFILLNDWNQAHELDEIDGMEAIIESLVGSSNTEVRQVRVFQGTSRSIAVVAYAISDFDVWAFDCISDDLVQILNFSPEQAELELDACLKKASLGD